MRKSEEETKKLKNYDGILIPGGFGSSGVEGKIKAIKYAREHNIPFLGLCYGMQLAVVEYARNVCGLDRANTAEVDPKTPHPVIDILPTQKELLEKSDYGGTMRLGAYSAILKKSKTAELYRKTSRLTEDTERLSRLKKDESQAFRLGILEKDKDTVLERHRHRYEVNPKYVPQLEEKGLIFSAYHIRKDNQKLMEFIELPKHKFFMATQAHPEFKSRLEKPAPLFLEFVRAASK